MVTQEQVNIEVGKLYTQMADYISRKVQGSDTFSGLSGNQHAELEALAKDLSAKIADIEGETSQKIKATNMIANEIANLIVNDPNSPYFEKYTASQLNVLALQSILGGKQEYINFGQKINESIVTSSLKGEFVNDLETDLRGCYSILNGKSGSAREPFARNNGTALLDFLSEKQKKEIDDSLIQLKDLESALYESRIGLVLFSENYYNVNEENLNKLLFREAARPNPIVTFTGIALAAFAVSLLGACTYVSVLSYISAKELIRNDRASRRELDKREKHNFCMEVSKAIELFYNSIRYIIAESVVNPKISTIDCLNNLLKLKNSEKYKNLAEIQNKSYKSYETNEPISFVYGKDCIEGKVRLDSYNAFSELPSSRSAIEEMGEPARESKLEQLKVILGGMAKFYSEAATFNLARAKAAEEMSGLADAARRRRAVTHLIEWAAYGAVSVGVIWGLSKVYKGYKSDD